MDKPIWKTVHPKVLDSMARIGRFMDAVEDYTRRKKEADAAYARYLERKELMTDFDFKRFEYLATGKVGKPSGRCTS